MHDIIIAHYHDNAFYVAHLNFRGRAGGSYNFYWRALIENLKEQKLKPVVLLMQMFLE